MTRQELADTAKTLVGAGKGILAADESTSTITRRFKSISLPSTEENRRDYREAIHDERPGTIYQRMILHDETIRQKTHDGISIPELLNRQGCHQYW